MPHFIDPTPDTLHGHFSPDLPPILTVQPGETVSFRTLDAHWDAFAQPDPFGEIIPYPHRDRERDPGHALCGPVAIAGAKAGMVLEVRIKQVITGGWGWSSGGGYASPGNDALGLTEGETVRMKWRLDPARNLAVNQFGHQVAMRPFPGLLGMPPPQPGRHSTTPPRPWGGNMDCKELVAGSAVFFPIPVDGGLFSIGDGHAAQGDGESSGVAIECPLELVEVAFHLHPAMRLTNPRARTPAGWLTFGFDEDLTVAAHQALDGMLDLMGELAGLERKSAFALASLVVDLRITQIVNQVRGVHAVLPYDALPGLMAG